MTQLDIIIWVLTCTLGLMVVMVVPRIKYFQGVDEKAPPALKRREQITAVMLSIIFWGNLTKYIVSRRLSDLDVMNYNDINYQEYQWMLTMVTLILPMLPGLLLSVWYVLRRRVSGWNTEVQS